MTYLEYLQRLALRVIAGLPRLFVLEEVRLPPHRLGVCRREL